MRVLIGCEFSGIVRDAFIRHGHDAMSCDLLPTESPGPHYQGDVFDIINDGWDLGIFHPPCTRLCVSGVRWFKDKKQEQESAYLFFMALVWANIPKIALENPIGIMSTRWRKPDQIIHPWQFGHGETKATCLWLKGLPKLIPTKIVDGRENRILRIASSKDRGKERSRTYAGIAEAMAEQWGEIYGIKQEGKDERDTEI